MSEHEGSPEAVSRESESLIERDPLACVLYGGTLAAEGKKLETAQFYVRTPEARKWLIIGWKAHMYDTLEARNAALLEMAMLDKGVEGRDL